MCAYTQSPYIMAWIPVKNYSVLEDIQKAQKIFLRGRTFSGDEAWGSIECVHPGIGYDVRCNNTDNLYLIVSDLSYSIHSPSPSNIPSEVEFQPYLFMSPEMIHYWLETGFTTKYALTLYEMDSRELLDPMSKDGIRSSIRPYPILTPEQYVKLIKNMYPYEYNTVTYAYDAASYQYFMETGEIYNGKCNSHLRKKELEHTWHLNRALVYRLGDEIRVPLISPCGNYTTVYNFDEVNNILHVEDDCGSTISRFIVEIPPPSNTQKSQPSPYIQSSPYIQPSHVSNMSSICAEEDVLDINVQESPYSHYLSKCSNYELADEKQSVEQGILCGTKKLASLLEEEENRKNSSVRVKIVRLSRAEIEEGLEAAHHEIKIINRNYRGMSMPFNILEELEGHEAWCTAAYSVLSSLRQQ